MKRIYKIPVGNHTKEEIEEMIRDLRKSCGILTKKEYVTQDRKKKLERIYGQV